jgi:hypothetical protein
MSYDEYDFETEEVANDVTEDEEEEKPRRKKAKVRRAIQEDEEEEYKEPVVAKPAATAIEGLAWAVPKSAKYYIVFNRKVFQRFVNPLGAQIKYLHLMLSATSMRCDALNPTHTVMLKAALEHSAHGVVPAGETFCVDAELLLDATDFDFDEFVLFRDGDRVGIAAGSQANYIDTLAEDPQEIPVVPMNVHFTLLISIKKMKEIFRKKHAEYVLIKLFETEGGGCIVEFTSQGTGITRTQRINSVMEDAGEEGNYSVRASAGGGAAKAEVCKYEGAFASAFVAPLLQHMVGEMVQLQFSLQIKPMIVTYSLGSPDSKIVALFMPKA